MLFSNLEPQRDVVCPQQPLKITISSKFALQNPLFRQASPWFKHDRTGVTGENTRLSRKRWCTSQGPQITAQWKKKENYATKVMWRLHLEAKKWGCIYHLQMFASISTSQKHVLNSSSDTNVYCYSILYTKKNTIILCNFSFNLPPILPQIWKLINFEVRRLYYLEKNKKYFGLRQDGTPDQCLY